MAININVPRDTFNYQLNTGRLQRISALAPITKKRIPQIGGLKKYIHHAKALKWGLTYFQLPYYVEVLRKYSR